MTKLFHRPLRPLLCLLQWPRSLALSPHIHPVAPRSLYRTAAAPQAQALARLTTAVVDLPAQQISILKFTRVGFARTSRTHHTFSLVELMVAISPSTVLAVAPTPPPSALPCRPSSPCQTRHQDPSIKCAVSSRSKLTESCRHSFTLARSQAAPAKFRPWRHCPSTVSVTPSPPNHY